MATLSDREALEAVRAIGAAAGEQLSDVIAERARALCALEAFDDLPFDAVTECMRAMTDAGQRTLERRFREQFGAEIDDYHRED